MNTFETGSTAFIKQAMTSDLSHRKRSVMALVNHLRCQELSERHILNLNVTPQQDKQLMIREITPDDVYALKALYQSLSASSIYN